MLALLCQRKDSLVDQRMASFPLECPLYGGFAAGGFSLKEDKAA